MKRGISGTFRTAPALAGEAVRAFVPTPLPPVPALVLEGELREELDRALLGLGRLDSVSSLLPNPALFLYMYVRKEAVLSSQIEGAQSSLAELLLFEMDQAPGVPFDDVREVSNYVRALEYGVERIRAGFPLSNRLFRELHSELLGRGRGSEKQPGKFRTTQNWIGGTRPGNAVFVPPPPDELLDCMSALEKFLHDQPVRTPTLIKAALAHVQFETIHPFLDGNGRLGRLLITLLLISESVLHGPLLYLSLYLKVHRATYYELLQRVRSDGDWEAWLLFFLHGVRETAEQVVDTTQRAARLFAEDEQRIAKFGRNSGSALRVQRALQQTPAQTIASLSRITTLTLPTVAAALRTLEQAGIVRELTGKKRGRVFAYSEYLKWLDEGTTTPA